MLVHFLLSEISHDAGLSIGCSFDSIVNDPIKVTVHSSLVHADDFFIKTLLSSSNNLFGISPASLLNLALTPFFLSVFDFLSDSFLLGITQKFLREFIKGFSNDLTLESLIHCITELFLVLLEQDLLSLIFGQVGYFSYN